MASTIAACCLSVVVQRMVFPEVSGILFTADPIDGRRHIVSIDAGFGLGEALVSGLVSADLYKLDKRTNEIVERKIAKKTLAIWPTPEGGTRQEAISGDRQTAPSLTDQQAKELATLGARIEAHYQAPQDIEWCIEAGKLYVVQSRPITTLYPLPEPTAPGTQLRVYISFSHAQVMTDALPPYAQSIWRHLFPFGRDDSGLSHTMLAAGGRLYLDPSDLLRVSPLGKAFARVLNAVDALMSAAVTDVIGRPEFGYGTGSKLTALRNVVPFLGPVLAKAMGRMWLTRPEGSAARALAFVDASVEKARVEARRGHARSPALRGRALSEQQVVLECVPADCPDRPFRNAGPGHVEEAAGRAWRGQGDHDVCPGSRWKRHHGDGSCS